MILNHLLRNFLLAHSFYSLWVMATYRYKSGHVWVSKKLGLPVSSHSCRREYGVINMIL